jgi:predicted phosphodiesterase
MKVAIISDIHGNLEALCATLQAIAAHPVERIVCLGDIVGYNTNPAECIALLRAHDVLCVAGNHDRAATGQITTDGFAEIAARAIAWTRRRLDREALAYLAQLPTELSLADALVAVHGALHAAEVREMVRLNTDARRLMSLEALVSHGSGARICAFGHTHRLGVFELRDGAVRELAGDRICLRADGWYLVNPGTVGQPRTDDRRATYLVLDTQRHEVTAHRVAYDAEVPFAKTRREGLLPFWRYLPKPIQALREYLPQPVRDALKRGLKVVGL